MTTTNPHDLAMPLFESIQAIENDAKFTAAKDVLKSYRRGLEKYPQYNEAKETAADFQADIRKHKKSLRPHLIALAAKFARGEAVHGCTSLAAYAKKFQSRGCLSQSQLSRIINKKTGNEVRDAAAAVLEISADSTIKAAGKYYKFNLDVVPPILIAVADGGTILPHTKLNTRRYSTRTAGKKTTAAPSTPPIDARKVVAAEAAGDKAAEKKSTKNKSTKKAAAATPPTTAEFDADITESHALNASGNHTFCGRRPINLTITAGVPTCVSCFNAAGEKVYAEQAAAAAAGEVL
jgi:hypothetical protein